MNQHYKLKHPEIYVTLPSVMQSINQINQDNCFGTQREIEEIHKELDREQDNSFLRMELQENIPARNNRREKAKAEPSANLTLKRRRTTR